MSSAATQLVGQSAGSVRMLSKKKGVHGTDSRDEGVAQVNVICELHPLFHGMSG